MKDENCLNIFLSPDSSPIQISRAFNCIYDSLYGKIISFANGIIRHKEDAEDIAQDIFVKIWKIRTEESEENNLKKLREGGINGFKPYLFKMTRNKCYKYFRKKSMQKKNEPYLQQRRYDNSQILHPSDYYFHSYRGVRLIVNIAQKKLDPKEYFVFKCFYKGLEYQEVLEEAITAYKTGKLIIGTRKEVPDSIWLKNTKYRMKQKIKKTIELCGINCRL